MLSRIAESLYWIGRYVERADDTSRILDVHLALLLDDPWASEDVVCASLLMAMGREPVGEVSADVVLDTLVWDRSSPASVVGSLGAARENARRSREVVSSELWESINVTWHEAARPGRRAHPHAFLSWVRERSAGFNGTADATLSRDEAWYFLMLGRSLERADMTARLAAARALTGTAGPSWVTLLQSCGAYQAFLRSAHGAIEDARAVEFLLLDPLFPRSLMSALVSAERSLDALSSLHGVQDRGRAAEAHRLLGMIRSELQFTPTAELLEDIYHVMERVQSACSMASDAVARRYFPRGVVTSWKAS
ncbi:MAG TPA: alpha-E domain-containing protein [Jatrophihabitantaceae bacterium]|nr:alpha-E domain-containing protein [Jatrophihabitantaceae bacterium]